MSTQLIEPLAELYTRSELLIWNFSDITELDRNKNIQEYMLDKEQKGYDPRTAFHRQEFNEGALSHTDARYLIGRYGENRLDILRGSHIADEGRTIHLAIDIFSQSQEPVYAPCSGKIVVSTYEPGLHNYGNYLILQPDDVSLPYIFFGHLANDRHDLGKVSAGEQLGHLGSYENLENGGWSIHLHLQLLKNLPAEGKAPIGYSTLEDLPMNQELFPDPLSIFKDWVIQR
jgi:murein DD-endopeptidase MepM/ murein hydrolase activator NlpD